VRNWFTTYQQANPTFKETTDFTIPTTLDDVHIPTKIPVVSITSPAQDVIIDPTKLLTINLQETGVNPIQKSELYLNGKYVLTNTTNPLSISFIPADIGGLSATNTASITVYDSAYNQAQASLDFSTNQ
jgi:hypothetical protein